MKVHRRAPPRNNHFDGSTDSSGSFSSGHREHGGRASTPASTSVVSRGVAAADASVTRPTRARAGRRAGLAGPRSGRRRRLLFGVPLGRSFGATRRRPRRCWALSGLCAHRSNRPPFGTRDLRGKVWDRRLHISRAVRQLPSLSQKMAENRHRARQLGPDFRLVSLTVDPERDTRPCWPATPPAMAPTRQMVVLTGSMATSRPPWSTGQVRHGRERWRLWEIFHGENLCWVDRMLADPRYFLRRPTADRLMEALGSVANALDDVPQTSIPRTMKRSVFCSAPRFGSGPAQERGASPFAAAAGPAAGDPRGAGRAAAPPGASTPSRAREGPGSPPR